MYSELTNDVNYDYVVSAGELVYVGPNVYLQGTGTQYIDTGIGLSGAVEFAIEARIDDFSTDEKVIFGANYAAQANTAQYHLRTKADKCSLFIGDDQDSQTQYSYDILNDTETGFHTISLLKYSFTDWRYLYKDGNAIVYNISKNTIADYDTPNYYLFANNYGGSLQSGSESSVSIKDLQLFKNSVPLLHLVPVPAGIRLNAGTPTAPCMYDVLNKQFYTNLGTGNFILASTSGVAPTIKYVDNSISKLYHSAKGPNNYTVVGSPTIVDGILTNVDANNRVKIANLNLGSNSFEISSKVKFSQQTASSYGVYGFPNKFLPMYIVNRASFAVYIRESSADNWSTITLPASMTPQVDIWYWWKVKHDGNGNYTFSVSTDKQNWVSATSSLGVINLSAEDFLIGRASGGNAGAIDLNETYITVNGQPLFGNCPVEVKKHQIKGPVGYAVVGSPTIADGVVSGFSSSDYLQTSSSITNDNFELKIKFKTGASVSEPQTLFYTTGCQLYIIGWARSLGIRYNTTEETSVYCDGDSNKLVPNTTYFVKLVYNKQSSIIIYLSTDDNYYEKIAETLPTKLPNIFGGICTLGWNVNSYFFGSIDLNETYIKVNGKLWYWQPQETKTITVNGVTVFNKGGNADYIIDNGQLIAANKNLYLESFGAQYIDTGIYGTDLTDYELTWQTTDTTGAYQTIIGARENSSSIDRRFSVLTGDDTNRDTSLYVTSRYTKTGNWEHTYTDLVSLAKRNLKKVGNSVQLNGGTTYSYSAPSTFTTPNTLKLFAMDTNGTVALYFSGKMYPCVIYENNVFVRNFVPVPQGLKIGAFTVPSNGMFDIVSQTFFGNLGSGSFTVGKDA